MDWASAVRAIAEAVVEVCKLLQTTEGQEWMKAARADNAAARKQLESVGQWFAGLVRVNRP